MKLKFCKICEKETETKIYEIKGLHHIDKEYRCKVHHILLGMEKEAVEKSKI